jgi:hypothetical protein
MPGWMSSSSTSRRIDRAFDQLADAHAQVLEYGHDAANTPIESASFFVRPPAGDALVSFDDGVPAALRRHLTSQGLTLLSELVGDLESIGRRVSQSDESDHTVSAIVYQMH